MRKKIVDFRAKFWRDPTFGPPGQATKDIFGQKHIYLKRLNHSASNGIKVARPLEFLSKVFFLSCITLNFISPKIHKKLKFHVYKSEYTT